MKMTVDSVKYVRGKGTVVVVKGGDETPGFGMCNGFEIQKIEYNTNSGCYGLYALVFNEVDPNAFLVGSEIDVPGSDMTTDSLTWETRRLR